MYITYQLLVYGKIHNSYWVHNSYWIHISHLSTIMIQIFIPLASEISPFKPPKDSDIKQIHNKHVFCFSGTCIICVCVYWCPRHIVLCCVLIWFALLHLCCQVLWLSILIVHSIFSNVYVWMPIIWFPYLNICVIWPCLLFAFNCSIFQSSVTHTIFF